MTQESVVIITGASRGLGAAVARWLAEFMPNIEVLKMATSYAAEMIKLVGPNNPYQDGAQGVVQEGAYADLLLVEGNPLEDILVMTKPDENFKVIMKTV